MGIFYGASTVGGIGVVFSNGAQQGTPRIQYEHSSYRRTAVGIFL